MTYVTQKKVAGFFHVFVRRFGFDAQSTNSPIQASTNATVDHSGCKIVDGGVAWTVSDTPSRVEYRQLTSGVPTGPVKNWNLNPQNSYFLGDLQRLENRTRAGLMEITGGRYQTLTRDFTLSGDPLNLQVRVPDVQPGGVNFVNPSITKNSVTYNIVRPDPIYYDVEAIPTTNRTAIPLQLNRNHTIFNQRFPVTATIQERDVCIWSNTVPPGGNYTVDGAVFSPNSMQIEEFRASQQSPLQAYPGIAGGKKGGFGVWTREGGIYGRALSFPIPTTGTTASTGTTGTTATTGFVLATTTTAQIASATNSSSATPVSIWIATAAAVTALCCIGAASYILYTRRRSESSNSTDDDSPLDDHYGSVAVGDGSAQYGSVASTVAEQEGAGHVPYGANYANRPRSFLDGNVDYGNIP